MTTEIRNGTISELFIICFYFPSKTFPSFVSLLFFSAEYLSELSYNNVIIWWNTWRNSEWIWPRPR